MSATWEERQAWEARHQLKDTEKSLNEAISHLRKARDNFAGSGDTQTPGDCNETLQALQSHAATLDRLILSLNWGPEDLPWVSVKAHQQQLREE